MHPSSHPQCMWCIMIRRRRAIFKGKNNGLHHPLSLLCCSMLYLRSFCVKKNSNKASSSSSPLAAGNGGWGRWDCTKGNFIHEQFPPSSQSVTQSEPLPAIKAEPHQQTNKCNATFSGSPPCKCKRRQRSLHFRLHHDCTLYALLWKNEQHICTDVHMFGPKTFSSIACRYVLVQLQRATLHRVMVYVYPCTGNGEILATALIIIII